MGCGVVGHGDGEGRGRGVQRAGVDPPLRSSRACLTAFIAFTVPFVFVSLGQCHPVPFPHLPESGEGRR